MQSDDDEARLGLDAAGAGAPEETPSGDTGPGRTMFGISGGQAIESQVGAADDVGASGGATDGDLSGTDAAGIGGSTPGGHGLPGAGQSTAR